MEYRLVSVCCTRIYNPDSDDSFSNVQAPQSILTAQLLVLLNGENSPE